MPNTRRLCAAMLAPLLLAGCGLPIGIQIASLFADGVSVLTTDKTLTDHGISAVTDKDCALWRSIEGKDICRKVEDDDIVVAETQRIEKAESAQRAAPAAASAISPPEDSGHLGDSGAPRTDKTLEQTWGETASAEHDKNKDLSKETPEFPQEVSAEGVSAPPSSSSVPPAPPTAAAPKVRHLVRIPIAPSTAPRKARTVTQARKPATVKATVSPVKSRTARTGGGTYYIIASYHRVADAKRFSRKHLGMEPSVLKGTAKGRQVFRVAVGPVAKDQRQNTRNRLRGKGFKDTWKLTLRKTRAVTELASASR